MSVHSVKINIRQLNILAATIVLANGFSRLVSIPSRGVRISFLNLQWSVEVSGRLPFMVLLAFLVIVGAESIFRSHPILSGKGAASREYSTVAHWILPGLAAFGGSAAVSLFPAGPRWWLGLALISLLLVASVVGEYYVIDREDIRHDLASLGLNVLGLTLLAIVLSAIHANSSRLSVAIPVIGLAVSVISFRLLDLSIQRSRRMLIYSLGIGLIVAELTLPLFFMPISSVAFGLLLVLATHTLVGFAQAALNNGVRRSTLIEYGILDLLAVILLILLIGK
jgi:hypothetical protein